MASLNKVFLIGNLTRPRSCATRRAAPRWRTCGWPSTATTRPRAGRSGRRPASSPSWCGASRRRAAAEYLDKGSPVMVEGRLQTRDWETKDGQKRNVVEVVAERVQFMGRGASAARGGRRGVRRAGRGRSSEAPATTTSRSSTVLPRGGASHSPQHPRSPSSASRFGRRPRCRPRPARGLRGPPRRRTCSVP